MALGATCLLMPVASTAGTLTLDQVVSSSAGLRAVDIESAPGDTQNAYVLDLDGGEIHLVDHAGGGLSATPFFDGVPTDPSGGYGEGFTYSMAFDPDYETNGLVFITYRTTDKTVLAEYTRDASAPNRLDASSHREVLSIIHTDADSNPVTSGGRHDGGDISFGPDGYLYMSTGDSDLDFSGLSVSQDPGDLRGKILRIDPHLDGGDSYSLPDDGGNIGGGALPEIWATGLRNPFKTAWDPVTGRYFIADVGEDGWEEINLGAAGANYGWSAKEGPDSLPGNTTEPFDAVLSDPLYAYAHSLDPFGGHSVTGGEVYRGALAALDGQYVFGDYGGYGLDDSGGDRSSTAGRIWSFDAASAVGAISGLTEWSLDYLNGGTLDRILGFGIDGLGGLYVSDHDGDLFAVTSAVASVPLGGTGLFALTGLAVFAGRRRRHASFG